MGLQELLRGKEQESRIEAFDDTQVDIIHKLLMFSVVLIVL